jgi:hypothetical protein
MKLIWHIEPDRSMAEAFGGLIKLEVTRCTKDFRKYMVEAHGDHFEYLGKGIKGKGIGMNEACEIAEERLFEYMEKNGYKPRKCWADFIKKKG